MTSAASSSSEAMDPESEKRTSSASSKKLVLETHERARERFAEACSSMPLYQARLAKDPEYFKQCSPGQLVWPVKET
jgi:hypothetical protein